MTSAQNNSRGILFILMGMALFSIQDALIKFIYEDAALYELYFGRTFVAFILLVAIFESFQNKKLV
jgi:drug/metabolite transporter (DMT)-like permease